MINRNTIPTLVLIASTFVVMSCSGPKARFIVPESDRTAPAEIVFENQSEDAERYIWDFGDGTTSTDSTGKHQYYESGNYLIKLKAIKGKKVSTKEERIKIDAPKECLVRIQTPKGQMIVQLFDDTPLHRDNFLKLIEEGFYNDLIFHRVINGFMIQGGDPESKNAGPTKRLGSGGPGYQIDEEIDDEHVHVKGALAAARQGDQVNPLKKSSGSQFYIVHGKPMGEQDLQQMEMRNQMRYTPEQTEQYIQNGGTPFLDNAYTVFGQVIQGLDVIDNIAKTPTGMGDRPKEDITMKISVIK